MRGCSCMHITAQNAATRRGWVRARRKRQGGRQRAEGGGGTQPCQADDRRIGKASPRTRRNRHDRRLVGKERDHETKMKIARNGTIFFKIDRLEV